MNMEQNNFEQIEALWRQQDERLQRIEHVQRESVARLLRRNITGTHRRFAVEWGSAAVLGVAVELAVLTQAGKFFGSWQLAVPYMVFVLVWGAFTVLNTVWYCRLRRHEPLSTPLVPMLRFADRWQLLLKRTILVGMGVVVPVTVATALPVMARIFGYEFHYAWLRNLVPWRIAVVAVLYVGGIGYYLYEMRLNRELKDNLRLYDELLADH